MMRNRSDKSPESSREKSYFKTVMKHLYEFLIVRNLQLTSGTFYYEPKILILINEGFAESFNFFRVSIDSLCEVTWVKVA